MYFFITTNYNRIKKKAHSGKIIIVEPQEQVSIN